MIYIQELDLDLKRSSAQYLDMQNIPTEKLSHAKKRQIVSCPHFRVDTPYDKNFNEGLDFRNILP